MSAAPEVLAAALAAYDAGLCVVRVTTDGNKKPVSVPDWGAVNKQTGKRGKGWKRFQAERATRDTVAHWFADGHPGLGVICGKVSGNLEMLELEARAVNEGLFERLVELAKAEGLYGLLERLVNGYAETTPSGGLHWLYYVQAEHVYGNTKLAVRPKTDDELAADPSSPTLTLIETRGEGGFTVCAPSHGPVHQTGRPYVMARGSFATIPTLSAAEYKQLHDLCRKLSAVPANEPGPPPKPVDPAKRAKVTTWSGGSVGDSWMDAVEAHLAASWTMRSLLEHYGWEHSHDAGSYVYMAHPSAHHDVSASINANGRLTLFTSSLSGLAFYSPTDGAKTPSYGVLDMLAYYEDNGDRDAAAERIAEQTGILDAWKRRQDDAWSEQVAEWMNAAGVSTGTAADDGGTTDDDQAADADADGIDKTTGEIPGADGVVDSPTNLPGSFWQARPRLAQIRQAAYHRSRSPDAVFGAVLARVAVQVPPTIQLPAIVGYVGTLDLLVANIAQPGGGKSTSVGVAKDLVPIDDDAIVLDFPPGSGEGLVDAYLGTVDDVGPDGKKVKLRRQVKRAVLAEVDEGEVLSGMSHRKGATLLPTLRSAWSGSVLGQGNASAETNRRLAPRSYRFAATIALQPAHAMALLDDAPGGTPQRVLWFSAEDPNLPDDEPPWPGPLVFEMPAANHFGFVYWLKVDDAIADEVKARSKAKTRGTLRTADPLDAHADLLRLKVAALLAIIDERLDINRDDWSLAGVVMATSRSVRTVLVETARRDAEQKELAATARAVRREVAIVGTVEARALSNAARAIGRRAHRMAGETIPRWKLTTAIASRDRSMVSVDDAIAEAERLGWIASTDGGWTAGKARPA